jgi:hypothetical protein
VDLRGNTIQISSTRGGDFPSAKSLVSGQGDVGICTYPLGSNSTTFNFESCLIAARMTDSEEVTVTGGSDPLLCFPPNTFLYALIPRWSPVFK